MASIDFEELRKSITADYTERIDLLKKEMAGELALLNKLEGRSQILTGKAKSVRTSPIRKASGEKRLNAKERILGAKQALHGEFTRKDLHAAVNNDGREEMKPGTFSPNVTSLIGSEIIEITKAVGNTPSTYMWTEEFEKM